MARRYPYPFHSHYADLKAAIENEVAGCENDTDLARLRGWVSSLCQDVQTLADHAVVSRSAEEEVA